MFSPNVIKQAHRQIEMAAASPGLIEVALLDRMIDLIVDRENVFDLIVFDTAPTGHTLQLLRMPDAMTTWIQALVRHRRAVVEIDRGADQTAAEAEAADPVLAALSRRHERLGRLRSTIMDRARTSFALVTIPERLAIEETARAEELLVGHRRRRRRADRQPRPAGQPRGRVLPLAEGAGVHVSRGDRPAVPPDSPRPGPPAAAGRLRPGFAGSRISEQLARVNDGAAHCQLAYHLMVMLDGRDSAPMAPLCGGRGGRSIPSSSPRPSSNTTTSPATSRPRSTARPARRAR